MSFHSTYHRTQVKINLLIGRYTCSGKKIAMAHSLRLTVAVLVSKYYISFAPGMDDELLVEKKMKDQLTPLAGDLELVFKELETPLRV